MDPKRKSMSDPARGPPPLAKKFRYPSPDAIETQAGQDELANIIISVKGKISQLATELDLEEKLINTKLELINAEEKIQRMKPHVRTDLRNPDGSRVIPMTTRSRAPEQYLEERKNLLGRQDDINQQIIELTGLEKRMDEYRSVLSRVHRDEADLRKRRESLLKDIDSIKRDISVLRYETKHRMMEQPPQAREW